MYDASIGRWNGVDAMGEEMKNFSPFSYAKSSPIMRLDPDGNWDVTIHAFNDREQYGYAIAVVTDRHGNEIYRAKVRVEGTSCSANGWNKRNQSMTNSDTPTGVYNILGWVNWSNASIGNRKRYGPNPVLYTSPSSGVASSSGRTGLHGHGGRQESYNAENRTWQSNDNPELKCTNGCIRYYDNDIAKIKALTDELEASDAQEGPGQRTVVEDLVHYQGAYYLPSDVEEIKNTERRIQTLKKDKTP
jgi:hypothetical protein